MKVCVVTEEYAEEDNGAIIGNFADKEKALSLMQKSADERMAEKRERWGKYLDEEKGKNFDEHNRAVRNDNFYPSITISKYRGLANINGVANQPYWQDEISFQVNEYELQ